MLFPNKFIKLMKSEPNVEKSLPKKHIWLIDESKFFNVQEIGVLQRHSNQMRINGLRKMKFSQIRKWFMIELGLNTGLRVSEMASLTHNNVFIDDNRSSLSFTGKGCKPRLVWISNEFRNQYQLYISYKKTFGYASSQNSPLLNNLKGTRITKRALQKDFKSMVISAGLHTRYHIHNLRHTYATFLLKASNNNYRFVQKQLGHASINTTQVYAGVLEIEGRKAVEKLYLA